MSEQLTEQITNNEEEKIQLPEPFQNEPEDKQPLSEPVSNNPYFNQQLSEPISNNPEDNQHNSKVKINTSKCMEPPNKTFYCLIISEMFLFIIEFIMNFCFVIRDIFEAGLRRYADEDEKRRDSHIGPYLSFGFPCLFLTIIVPFVSMIYSKHQLIFIVVFILILIKSGLFVGYFIHLSACRDNKDDKRLLSLFPEIGFSVLIIIHEIYKCIYFHKNKNQNNN